MFSSCPTDDRPTLSQLITFQGKSKRINVAQEIGPKWQAVGSVLLDDRDGTIMPTIAQKFGSNAQEINMEVLSRWTRGEGIDCTWHVLLETLRGPCKALYESMREVLTEEMAPIGDPGKHIMQHVVGYYIYLI